MVPNVCGEGIHYVFTISVREEFVATAMGARSSRTSTETLRTPFSALSHGRGAGASRVPARPRGSGRASLRCGPQSTWLSPRGEEAERVGACASAASAPPQHRAACPRRPARAAPGGGARRPGGGAARPPPQGPAPAALA